MHPLWDPGDLVLLADHINLLGDNPLIGPNDDRLGPRFPDMSAPYDAALRALARKAALEQGITLREGVYVAVTGPEPRDAGRVPDAARDGRRRGRHVHGARGDRRGARRHAGAGHLVITDLCLPDALEPADVATIIATAESAEPRLTALLTRIVEQLA